MSKQMKQEIISVLVKNKANVLSRVVNLYGARGYNIDSLTVSTTNDPKLSRITIAFTANERSLQQLITQTEKLEVVESVSLMNREQALYRELLLVKIAAGPEQRSPIKEIVDIYRAKIVDLSRESLIIELTGTPEKINAFLDVIGDFEILEVCRTGVTGIEGNRHKVNKQVNITVPDGNDQAGGVY